MNYYAKQHALANLAGTLKTQGWTLYQYGLAHYNESDSGAPANWLGHAEHKRYPGLKVVSAFFWPKYSHYEGQPIHRTPAGYMWHIEQDGLVVAQGKGFTDCSYNTDAADRQRVVAAITEACARLTADATAAAAAQSPRGIAANTATPVAITEDGNWIWVKFAQKPDELVRVQLKQLGGSFSKRRQAWYFTSPQYLDQLCTLFPTATPQ